MKSNIEKNKRTRSLFAQLNIYVAIALSAVIKACTKEPLRVKVSHDFSSNTFKDEEKQDVVNDSPQEQEKALW